MKFVFNDVCLFVCHLAGLRSRYVRVVATVKAGEGRGRITVNVTTFLYLVTITVIIIDVESYISTYGPA